MTLREELRVETAKEIDRLNRIIKGEPPPDACPLCKQPLACGWWCRECKVTRDRAKVLDAVAFDHNLNTFFANVIVAAVVGTIVAIVCFF